MIVGGGSLFAVRAVVVLLGCLPSWIVDAHRVVREPATQVRTAGRVAPSLLLPVLTRVAAYFNEQRSTNNEPRPTNQLSALNYQLLYSLPEVFSFYQ